MEKIIKDLVQNFDGLSYVNVEDSGEGKLFGISIDYLDTLKLNKEQFYKLCQVLDNTEIIKEQYQIYCSYDKSGYEYWSNQMKEKLTPFIDIWLSDSFTNDDIDNLYISLCSVYNKIDDVYFNLF